MATESAPEATKSTSAAPKKGKPRKRSISKSKSTVAPKRRRKQSTPAERERILAAAAREGLTALDVQKRFGVKPVTYYSWRKQRAATGPFGRREAATRVPMGSSIAAQVRTGVQARVRDILPAIVREEVARYLEVALGNGGGRRRSRRAP